MSERLVSRNQQNRGSTEKQSLVILIGLGALLLIIELYTLGAHRHNRFYLVLILLSISGIPFVFAVWWTFERKKFPAGTLLIILIGGALFRLIFVPLDPTGFQPTFIATSGMDASRLSVSIRISICRSIPSSPAYATIPFFHTLTAENMHTRSTRL